MKVLSCLILLVAGCLAQVMHMPVGSPIEGSHHVHRPCRRYDLQCVRYFFENHAHCRKSYGRVPEPLFRAISNQFYPTYNMTVINTNANYTGFNTGNVEDLYVNRDTGNVVLTIDFQELTKSSKDVYIKYYRRGREPITTYGYSIFVFRLLTVTVIFPRVDNLQLDNAYGYGYSNAEPVLNIDHRLGESSVKIRDPSVAKSFALLRTDLGSSATQHLLTEAAFYAAVYIQNVICDFGLKLV